VLVDERVASQINFLELGGSGVVGGSPEDNKISQSFGDDNSRESGSDGDFGGL